MVIDFCGREQIDRLPLSLAVRLEIVARNNAERLASIVPPHAIYFMPRRADADAAAAASAAAVADNLDFDDELNDKTGNIHQREKIELMVR